MASFDSKCILDKEENRLTKYSFSQLNKLYEEKIKKLRPKGIKKIYWSSGKKKINLKLK